MSNHAASDNGLRPVCFMVMPFGRKPVSNARVGAPTEVDFDLLWDRAFNPAIDALGYTPVRADADTGSMIVQDMIERLAFADLIIADVSIPNGNVYYEVGIRHVARETGCVLVAANWSRQLFDIDQFRCLRYPLKSADVSDTESVAIRDMLVDAVPQLRSAQTPYHSITCGIDLSDPNKRGVFRDFAEELSRFQERVAAIRLMDSDEREEMVCELATEFAHARDLPDVSLELMRLFRDELGWEETLEFIETLPEPIQQMPYVHEQRLLALGNSGEPEHAIAGLEKLIEERGADPERHGLIGGRYKRLWRNARRERIESQQPRPNAKERRYLNKAIEHYTIGMQLDYNEYYCSANLPLLLRARDGRGDRNRADVTEYFVIAACERAIDLGSTDAWVWPTLLGAAFRSGDIDKADELADRIETDGLPRWNLAATLADLADIVKQCDDENVRNKLDKILERLNAILEEND
jgi:hypothetical protein